MARPLRIQYPGAFYHVMCRGNKGAAIFIDDDDRRRFLSLLDESLETYEVTLYVYVLMHNHFHMILQTPRPNLSAFMRRFNICYTGWFNYHHGTYGHLYQGRYKSLLVDADTYLLTLSRYVHLNPARINNATTRGHRSSLSLLQRYRWSSLPGYLDKQLAVKFIAYDLILSMVGGRRAYQRFITDGLKEDIANPFNDTKSQMVLGNERFLRYIRDTYTEKGSSREQPIYRKIKRRVLEPGTILDHVTGRMGISRRYLLTPRNDGVARGIACELLYRFSALTLREIGDLMGVDYSSIYKCRYRFKKSMSRTKRTADVYKEIVAGIENALSKV